MAIDTTNNIVYELLTEPRYRWWRRMLFVAMLIGCSFGQVFILYGEHIESLGYVAYIIGAALTLLYALLIHFNVTYLAPRLLFRGQYVEYFTLLMVGTIVAVLCVKFFANYPILYSLGVVDSFNSVSLMGMLPSLIITAICITSSLIPTLIRQWIIDTKNIDNLENRRLKSAIDEFKNHINTELLYEIIGYASQEVKRDPGKASEKIVSLSELLRYELYDCKREKVILHSDIEFTRNYLLLVSQVCASFVYSISVTGNTNLFVPPFRFLSFIQEILRQQPEMLDIHYVIDNEAIDVICKMCGENSSEAKSMRLELK